MTTKQFDLDKALKGCLVFTRSGRPVKQLHLFKCEDPDCLVGIVNGQIQSFTKDGKYFVDNKQSSFDLFIKE